MGSSDDALGMISYFGGIGAIALAVIATGAGLMSAS